MCQRTSDAAMARQRKNICYEWMFLPLGQCISYFIHALVRLNVCLQIGASVSEPARSSSYRKRRLTQQDESLYDLKCLEFFAGGYTSSQIAKAFGELGLRAYAFDICRILSCVKVLMNMTVPPKEDRPLPEAPVCHVRDRRRWCMLQGSQMTVQEMKAEEKHFDVIQVSAVASHVYCVCAWQGRIVDYSQQRHHDFADGGMPEVQSNPISLGRLMLRWLLPGQTPVNLSRPLPSMEATYVDSGDFATPNAASKPDAASVRMTLPGPTWPLDSHPDNVRKFVAQHMRAPKQADAALTPPASLAKAAPETTEKPADEKKENPLMNMPREELEKLLQDMGWCKAHVPAKPAAPAESAKAVPPEPAVESACGHDDASKSVAVVAAANDPSKSTPVAPTAKTGEGLKSLALNNALVHAPVPPTGTSLRIAHGTPLQIGHGLPPQGDQSKMTNGATAPAAPTAPAPEAPAVAAASAEPPNGVKLEDQKLDQRQCYSRRAAANLIQRLRDNPKRMEGIPSLQKMVHDESKKSELITILCDNNGSLEAVGAYLQAFEETWHGEFHKKRALRWTKKEMEDHYGADAEKVMNYKRQQGLVEDDENCPGTELYLIARKEDEVESGTRGGPSAFQLSKLGLGCSNSLDDVAMVAFVAIDFNTEKVSMIFKLIRWSVITLSRLRFGCLLRMSWHMFSWA
eukprot:s3256_g7.t1